MRVIRHLSFAALALSGALALAGCSGTEETAAAPTEPADSAETIAPRTVPSDSATDESDVSPTASVAPGASESPAADAAESPGSTGAESPGSTGAAGSGPVTGPADLKADWVHVGDDATNACDISADGVTCYLATVTGDSECQGDTPLAVSTFSGGAVSTSCSPLGDAGAVPFVNPGQKVADPSESMICQVVDAPSIGLRCTDSRSGVTALLTAAETATL